MAANKPSPTLVWTQSQPERRRAPAPLSREKIVRSALALADREGLDAVSLRNVAARLGVGPMRLYGYTATKEGLFALMVDAVYAELVAGGGFRGDWRAVLGSLATRLREATRRHPWFVSLLGGRLHLGPNALAFLELVLSGLRRTITDLDLALEAARVLNAWVIGALHTEANDLAAERETGLDEKAWHEVTWPWLEGQLRGGALPNVEAVVVHATHPSAETIFARGLETVLDGVEAMLERRKR